MRDIEFRYTLVNGEKALQFRLPRRVHSDYGLDEWYNELIFNDDDWITVPDEKDLQVQEIEEKIDRIEFNESNH